MTSEERALINGPTANLLWLANPPGRSRAVLIPTGVQCFPSWALSAFAETVVSSPDRIFDLPSAAFDLVIVDAHGHAAAHGSGKDLIRGVSSRLRPRGELLIFGVNPTWFRGSKPKASNCLESMASPVIERMLRREGFENVRRFYLTPSSITPFSVVPARVSTTTWHARFQVQNSASHWARVLACRVGLHDRLYAGRMILGTRC
jgi:hypothetical protein